VRRLLATGVAAEAIHGNKSQGQRERALAAFKTGKARVLVATEIAARGIDVDDVSHVINFELPNVPEQYVHRIGRTARAGAAGCAVSLCAPDERAYLRDIEKVTRTAIEVIDHPFSLPTPAPDARTPAPPKSGRGGGGRGRPQGQGQHQRREGGASHAQQSRREGAPPAGRGDGPRAPRPAARPEREVWSNQEPAPRAERQDRPERSERPKRPDRPPQQRGERPPAARAERPAGPKTDRPRGPAPKRGGRQER
jgi:ATP-dependent RNA helicase RhlE